VDKTDRIYVAGGETLVGKGLLCQLDLAGYSNVVDTSSVEPDLTDGTSVDAYFEATRPDYVFLAAGKSGGIGANQRYPADLMLNNLLIQCQIIRSAQRHAVRKLLYLASSCTYPRSSPQPMQVRSLMTGPLESTSEAYAMAKIAGIKLCQAYRRQYGADMISVIPSDVFGPGDDFGLEDAHVIAALIRRMHQAKIDGAQTVEVWGSGSPRREFIFVDDVAEAAIFLMQSYSDPTPINVGNGSETSIKNIGELIRKVVGYEGQLRFDPTKPDGMPLKALDSSEIVAMGWHPKVSLQRGLEETYRWFLDTTSQHG
jgi:GDP-L-fucose synthase